MNREQILATLRAHEQQLKDSGIVRLWLFGSTARDEASPDSDVDLLPAFNAKRWTSLRLGCKVDLSEEGRLKLLVWKSLETEIVRAL